MRVILSRSSLSFSLPAQILLHPNLPLSIHPSVSVRHHIHMSARPVYDSPIMVSSGGESPRRTGSRGVRGHFTYGYGNRSCAGNSGSILGVSNRMGSRSGLSRADSGYRGAQFDHPHTSNSRTDGRSRSQLVISSDDGSDGPDAHLLAELTEVKQGLARVEDRIEGLL